MPWAKYSYIKASETCAEKFKNGGRLFEPKDEKTNNMVVKTITSYSYSWPGDFFLGIVADTYMANGNGTLKVTGKGPSITSYQLHILICNVTKAQIRRQGSNPQPLVPSQI